MLKWVAAVALALAVVLSGRLALGDAESDRASLKREINDKVRRIADKLSGFDSRRDASYADEALSYAREVSDLVSKLRDVKESDSEANTIVSNYPGYLESFRDGMRYLKEIKRVQFLADGVADRCTRDEADLQTLIRNYVARPDDADEAVAKLPAKGQEYGRTYAQILDKLKDANNEFNSNSSYVRFDISVSSSDPWYDVKDKYKDAASRMIPYWKERYTPIDAACKRLGLGEKHPDIERAVSDLRAYSGETKSTVTQLKKDYNAWLREVRQLRSFAMNDRDEIRTAICTAGEYEVDRRVKEVADRWAGQISSSYGTMLGLADRLRSRAQSDKLKKYKGSKWVLEGLLKNIETMEKMKNYELQGANNPKIRTKLEWGNKRHADLQSGLGCAFKEVGIEYCSNAIRPGSGCRADCLVISGSTCRVVEIKPDSSGGKSEGPAQVDAYMKGFIEWYKRDKTALFAKYPGMSGCQDREELRIATDVVYYEFCSSTVRDEFGDVFSEISGDLTEDAE
jgi:hypothetical protein